MGMWSLFVPFPRCVLKHQFLGISLKRLRIYSFRTIIGCCTDFGAAGARIVVLQNYLKKGFMKIDRAIGHEKQNSRE